MIPSLVSGMASGLAHWLWRQIVETLGVPGIIGLAAAAVLGLSLSARAVKGLTSRKGLAVAALVMIVAFAAMFLTWPKSAPARPMETAEAAASVEPPPVEPDIVAEKIEPVANETAAMIAAKPAPPMQTAFMDMPPMAIAPTVAPVPMLPMEPSQAPHIPTIRPVSPSVHHRPAARQGHTTTTVHSSTMPQSPGGQHNPYAGGMGTHLNPAQQAHQARNLANQHALNQMNQAFHQMNSMPAMGGMPGGMHMGGVQHGMGHMPVGGMGHHGGHN